MTLREEFEKIYGYSAMGGSQYPECQMYRLEYVSWLEYYLQTAIPFAEDKMCEIRKNLMAYIESKKEK